METNSKSNINQQVREMSTILAENIETMLQAKVKTGVMIANHEQVIRHESLGISELLSAVYQADSQAYEGLYLTDSTGKIINNISANNPEKAIGISVADRPAFKKAMNSGNTIISDVVISRSNGKPGITIFSPVKDHFGNFIGTIGQAISLEVLEGLRSQVNIGKSGYAVVSTNVDGKATTIAHPDETLVSEQKDVSELGIIKASMGGQEQIMTFKGMKGESLFGATHFVKSTGWIATVLVPEEEIYASIIENRYKMLGVISLMIIIVIILTWIFARKITKRLIMIVQWVEKVANGDLRSREIVDQTTDEIGQLGRAMHVMSEKLSHVIQKVSFSAEQVAASSQQLKTGAEQSAQGSCQVATSIAQVAEGAEKQTLAIDKTMSVVNQISEQIKQTAATVQKVKDMTSQTVDIAKSGGNTMRTAVDQMSTIEVKVGYSAQVVTNLGARSKEIGNIVDTISGIAGQTNLLALNAAIEAARAGEQGKGFAVVAEEVRKLAEQSQESAKQIAFLINEIQGETNNAVVAIQEGTNEVKTGAAAVDNVKKNFQEIIVAIEQVTTQVEQILTATQVIVLSNQEIVGAVKEIDDVSKSTSSQTQNVSAVTQEQSASMEEIAASSNSLANMAGELQSLVENFKV